MQWPLDFGQVAFYNVYGENFSNEYQTCRTEIW
jgi:hypothetical protein